MNKILKILGKRGRITIPWEIRQALGFVYTDVVSFEVDGDTVLVKREKLCNGGKTVTAAELKGNAKVMINLSLRWAETQRGGENCA